MSAVRAMADTSRGWAYSRSMRSRARRRWTRSAISSGVTALRVAPAECPKRRSPWFLRLISRSGAHPVEGGGGSRDDAVVVALVTHGHLDAVAGAGRVDHSGGRHKRTGVAGFD